MIKSFKKLISETKDLNDVQQNVFDTVTEIQSANRYEFFSFDDSLLLSSNVDTAIGAPFFLAEGEYCIEYGGILVISYTSEPSTRQGFIYLNRLSNTSEQLITARYVGLADMGSTLRRSPFQESINFKSKGERLQLYANILTTGGTVSSRDVFNPYVKAIRKVI